MSFLLGFLYQYFVNKSSIKETQKIKPIFNYFPINILQLHFQTQPYQSFERK